MKIEGKAFQNVGTNYGGQSSALKSYGSRSELSALNADLNEFDARAPYSKPYLLPAARLPLDAGLR